MRVWSCSANLRSNTCVELKQLLLNCFPALVLQIVVWTGSNSRHNRFRNGRSTTFPESFLRLGASPDIHVHRTALFFIFLRGHIYLLHSLLPATSEIAASPKYSGPPTPTPTLETGLDYRCGRRGFGSGLGRGFGRIGFRGTGTGVPPPPAPSAVGGGRFGGASGTCVGSKQSDISSAVSSRGLTD